MHQRIEERRIRFAYCPVRRFTAPRSFTAPEGCFWLSKTNQTSNISEGWVAFTDDTAAQLEAVARNLKSQVSRFSV